MSCIGHLRSHRVLKFPFQKLEAIRFETKLRLMVHLNQQIKPQAVVTLVCLAENLASVVIFDVQTWVCSCLCIYAHLLNYSALLTCHFSLLTSIWCLGINVFWHQLHAWHGRLDSMLQLCDSSSIYDYIGRGLTAYFHKLAARCNQRGGHQYFSCACLFLTLQISSG